MVFRGVVDLSRCLWRICSVFSVFQLYHTDTVYCLLRYFHRLNDSVRKPSDHESKRPSGELRLPDSIPFQKLVIVESVEAAAARERVQITGDLRSQQSHHVIHGVTTLSNNRRHLPFCRHWPLHPIKRLLLQTRKQTVAA